MKDKHISTQLNKAFDSRIRLGLMSVLAANDEVEFSRMKEILDLTDGNLASHVAALEKVEYIAVFKQFVGKKPNTTYKITQQGRKAFAEHLDALEALIKGG
jgi:DNA-binding MarR family transcriptional regulator